jgi:hypothetical protein
MKLQHDDIDDLIGKVLAGEATEQEQQQLNAWLAAKPRLTRLTLIILKLFLIKRLALM